MKNSMLFGTLILLTATVARPAEMPTRSEYTNCVGMKFVRIEPGTFKMGQLKTPLPSEVLPSLESGYGGGHFDLLANGDFDERPVHTVKISKPFYMGCFEVTNFQYELFEAEHKLLRGKNGFSKDDNEAVIFVNWYQAKAFCDWLSEKEGLPYRLPTEAEWEYACRAGTATNFHTGDILPKEFEKRGKGVSLSVGRTKPNSWGLFDMHGNVEEWCQDWYGPYVDGSAIDPVGYAEGNIRVTRGGSHGTWPYYLRSANRMGTVPEDKHEFIGFRLIIGEMPKTKPLPMPPKPLCQQNVIQRRPAEISKGPDPDKPYFKGPRVYVRIPREAAGPVFAAHNHNPQIVACPNGDLLATWCSSVTERRREMTIGGTRLRYGHEQWDPASLFWDGPDRNNTAPGMWSDENGKIYWTTGLSAGANYGQSAKVLRTSTDSGATWSSARIMAYGREGPLPGSVAFKLKDGTLVGNAFVRMMVSRDNGLTWADPGGRVRGGHICAVQLKDGKFFLLTREEEVDGMMAISSSDDLGKSYTYRASIFPPIGGGQSPAMFRLKEGPIFFATFAGRAMGMTITDSSGTKRKVRGLIAAISEDECKSWSNVKLVTDDGPGKSATSTDGGCFAFSQRNSEYRGYMSACQAPNGLVHLVTSRSHYTFNLAWLKTPNEPLKHPPIRVKHETETFDGPRFDLADWEPYHGHGGGFNGKGQYTMIAKSHFQGMNRLIGVGSFEINLTLKNIHYNPRSRNASPGFTFSIKDEMARRLHFNMRDDKIDMIMFVGDGVKSAPFPEGPQYNVKYSKPPTAAQLKFIYNQKTRRLRVFYGLNGAKATTELPQSKVGVYFAEPLSECTAAYIMMSNGNVDLDYFEIKPINL